LAWYFVIIAQLAPSFWCIILEREDQNGAAAGIIIGFQFVVIHF
jgi:hypothetical protein